ncbi:MAG: sigma-54-dependent transcriptional regulator, partial [Kiloniellaceae bacterium]
MPGDNGATVFFVDDDPDIRAAVRQGLELADFRVACFDSAEAALPRLSRGVNGIVVTDIRMPGADGTELMRRVLEIDPAIPVVLVTGHGDVAMAVDAMRAGAYDFIEKPFDTSYLTDVVARAIEKRRLVLENRALRKHLDAGTGLEAVLVGRSAPMKRLREQVTAIAAAGADALVIGETGAGKEVIARALHDFSARKDGPFVAINCGALPADMIESELFGHESGAFTGAARQRIGKLEHANGGTVFLDEIESMSIDLQVKLLRAIEERGIVRLGANTPIRLDIRFVTATKL